MFDAEEEIRPQKCTSPLELREGVEISHIDFSYVLNKPTKVLAFQLLGADDSSCRSRLAPGKRRPS